MCQEKYQQIYARVGDAEDLPFQNDEFSLVYCFQSTWYFPNLDKAISEMFRVVKRGGYVVFDIQNLLSPQIFYSHNIRVKIFDRIVKFLANIKRIIQGKKDLYDFYYHEKASSPHEMRKILELQKGGIRYKIASQDNMVLRDLTPRDYFSKRLIYFCQKA
jgi:ubiquinone/menaquinone biosynthesis C-methylase UbiE